MPPLEGRMLELVGSCKIHTDGTSTGSTGWKSGAVSATARSAAGLYTVTLASTGQGGADDQECVAIVTPQATLSTVALTWTSDTVLSIQNQVGGANTDSVLKVLIFKVRRQGS